MLPKHDENEFTNQRRLFVTE